MKLALLPILLAAVATSAQAQETTLKVGDAAPALDVAHWIKGDPVTQFKPGQCYVVEFWATWCPPCKDSMPHLTELQEEFGDEVIIIGLSDESLDVAKSFLDKPEWAEKTHYTLGTDPDRSVYADYMTAAKQRGIPTSFLVNGEGEIAWIGHPAAGMDRQLKKMLFGDVGDKVERDMDEGFGQEAPAGFMDLMNKEWKSTDAAKLWIDKGAKALEANGWSWDFEQRVTVKAGQPGGEMQELPLLRKGTVERADDLGTRIDSANIMDFPGMPAPMKQEAVTVIQKGVYFVDKEPRMPTAPRELKSMTQKEAEELAQDGGNRLAPPSMAPFMDPNPMYADPLFTLSAINNLCAFDSVVEQGQQVVLRGTGSPLLAMGGGPGDGPPSEIAVELSFDKKTGQPLRLVIGNAKKPAFSMSFSNFAKVVETDPTRFNLNPEGKALPSLGDAIRAEIEMMRSMGPSGGGEADSDDF